MTTSRYIKAFVFSILATAVIFNACTKEKINETPEETTKPKPFTGTPLPTDTSIDPNSILGIHKNIISLKCNNPGCHDGTFEPDFRTVQSSYTTLVYAPVVKDSLQDIKGVWKKFKYRVVPGDTTMSFIHERLTTPTSEYMPSNGVRLTRKEIVHINNWIMNGAKDIYGNAPAAPDTLPQILFVFAIDSAGARLDTIRRNGPDTASPFLVSKTQKFRFVAVFKDDITPVKDFTLKQIKISDKKDDFSISTVVSATQFIDGGDDFKAWVFDFDATILAPNKQYYFRTYASDGTHGNQYTELPDNYMIFYYKEIYSFFINP